MKHPVSQGTLDALPPTMPADTFAVDGSANGLFPNGLSGGVFGRDSRIGNYRIERELGTTATGVLYQGVHLVLPRRAMIKVIHTSAIPALMERFSIQLLREACLLEALKHPGVPQVFESGRLADRRPWFAVQKIEGGTLAEQLIAKPLPAAEVVVLVRDIAEILEHAHRRGIIHRGLRPDRIVLAHNRRRFTVAIPDWSEARTHDAREWSPQVPAPETAPFLAPELVRGDAVDDRLDIYALGVIAYQALTGSLPRHAEGQPHLPTLDRCPDAPRELAQLIDQMLSPDRFDRPTSAEVRSDLDHLSEVLGASRHRADSEEVEDSPATALRIRRPRWTPVYGTHTTRSVLVGEIDLSKRSR